jgi:heterotetrameric sarcosine oxidase gamma subunit
VTEPSITLLPPAPLAVLELWGDPRPTAKRLAKALGHPLPAAGRWEGNILRLSPTSWLVEAADEALATALGEGGALTEVGGGYARVRIAGAGWRALLMESALFDAENPEFGPGCTATVMIEHVAVTLKVESTDACLALVPASHARDLIALWNRARVLVQA